MMNRSAIITLAGKSSRFSRSVGHVCHKSLYQDTPDDNTLLAMQLQLLTQAGFREIILVGGFCFDALEEFVKKSHFEIPIKLVNNKHYEDLGSCYSLCLGIDAVSCDASSVLFMEGDLLFDDKTFLELVSKEDDAITSTHSIVDARTSVAFYVTPKGNLRYEYDGNHKVLQVREPFVKIGDSGQVWQFANVKRLKDCIKHYDVAEWSGINLVPILDYYRDIDANAIRVCQFRVWFNCNTISDYRAMKNYVKENEGGKN